MTTNSRIGQSSSVYFMIVFVAKQTLDGESSALKELAKVEALALEVLLSGALERTRISGPGIGIFF